MAEDEPVGPGGIEPWELLTDSQKLDAIKMLLDQIIDMLRGTAGGGRGLGH